MNGLWGSRSERCFVDVRVFNPYVPSNMNSISAAYRRHKNTERRAYGQRVQETEHASFTPIVMSATGSLAPEASKWGDDYSVVMGWLHCSLSFSLLRSAIACARGPLDQFVHAIRQVFSARLLRVAIPI